MGVPLFCQDGAQLMLASYFDALTPDTWFTFGLITSSNTPATTDTASTYVGNTLSTSYYDGDKTYDVEGSGWVATISSLPGVQNIKFPTITFTFTGTGIPTVKGVAVFGGTYSGDRANLYFVESITAFTPMSGDVFKYTLTVNMGNCSSTLT